MSERTTQARPYGPLRQGFRPTLAFSAIVILGLSIRAPITSLASVLPTVQAELSMTPTIAGLISSLPIACFGLGAFAVAPIARKFGSNAVLTISLIVLATAIAARPFGGAWWMVALTIAIGLAITAGNVLLPVIIRRDFGSRQGPVVAGSTAAITASGTLGAALTAPLALWLGWRWALASWAIVTCIGILTTRFLGSESDPPSAARAAGAWRVPGAWVLTAYFGMLA